MINKKALKLFEFACCAVSMYCSILCKYDDDYDDYDDQQPAQVHRMCSCNNPKDERSCPAHH